MIKQTYCTEGTTCSKYPLRVKKIIKNSFGSIVSVFILVIFWLFLVLGPWKPTLFKIIAEGRPISDSLISEANQGLTAVLWIASGGIALLVLIAIGLIAANILYFIFYFYNITPEHIIIKKGIISRKEIVVPYEKVQNVFIDQDFWDRILGLYDVHVATADMQSAGMAHIDGVFEHDAKNLRGMILEKMKSYKDVSKSL